MRGEQATYSTGDMLKLINTAATNLILKKKKVALEGKLYKQQEERRYTLELIARARKKISELDPELRKAEEKAREIRERYSLLKSEHQVLEIELERLRETARKSALLKKRSAEVAALQDKVTALQGKYDLRSPAYLSLKRRHEELTDKKRAAEAAAEALGQNLTSLTSLRAQLIAGISDFDLAGHLETLRRDISVVGDSLGQSAYPEALEAELGLLISCQRCFKKVEELSRSLVEADPEVISMLAGADKLKTSGLLPAMSADLGRHAAVFAEYLQRAVGSLTEQKLAITVEIQTAEEKCRQMQGDLARAEEALKNEQEFRAQAQAGLRGLEAERDVQAAEMERTRKAAETVQVTMELNTALAKSLRGSNEYLTRINQRLENQFGEYKEAFEKVARLVREGA